MKHVYLIIEGCIYESSSVRGVYGTVENAIKEAHILTNNTKTYYNTDGHDYNVSIKEDDNSPNITVEGEGDILTLWIQWPNEVDAQNYVKVQKQAVL